MAHIPTQESHIEKVIRIAKELDFSIEDAAVTCDAFELAFSDEGLRRSIFGMIDQLDESAARKGEPLGLILTYAVELGQDGIRVGRYADEIPPGEVVHLVPTNRARILLRIKDDFPTQQFLGPIIMNRAVWEFESQEQFPTESTFQIPDPKLESEMEFESQIPNPKSQIRNPKSKIGYGVVCSDTGDERLPFLSTSALESQRTGAMSFLSSAGCTALQPARHLPPWGALQAGMPAFQSGLSPPPAIGELGHSDRKMFLRPMAIDVETYVSHFDL